MKICDLLSMCLGNLWRRKLRTLLTVIGVIIGTCSIVVMISIGVGINKVQMDMIEGMGDLTLITVYRNWEQQDVFLTDQTVSDIQAIPGVSVAAAFVDFYEPFMITSKDRYLYQGSIVGVNPEALSQLGYTTSEGHLLTASDVKGSILVGSKAAYQFYDVKRKRNNYVDPSPDEYGRIKDPFVKMMKDKIQLNIRDAESENWTDIPTESVHDLKVVGILEEGTDNEWRFDKTYTIYMDLSYAKELQKEYYRINKITPPKEETGYNQIYVKAASVGEVEAVEKAIQALGYNTDSLSSMREELQKQTATIQLVLGALGGISLLVAALGITNTMIMSIYERTREIGIMKVLGCAVSNIRTVFLMEAGAIGFIGGVAGIGLSYLLSFILNYFVGGSGMVDMGYGGGTTISIIPLWLVGLALAFATLVGLISGFSPANRAVKISALEAIKHD